MCMLTLFCGIVMKIREPAQHEINVVSIICLPWLRWGGGLPLCPLPGSTIPGYLDMAILECGNHSREGLIILYAGSRKVCNSRGIVCNVVGIIVSHGWNSVNWLQKSGSVMELPPALDTNVCFKKNLAQTKAQCNTTAFCASFFETDFIQIAK